MNLIVGAGTRYAWRRDLPPPCEQGSAVRVLVRDGSNPGTVERLWV